MSRLSHEYPEDYSERIERMRDYADIYVDEQPPRDEQENEDAMDKEARSERP